MENIKIKIATLLAILLFPLLSFAKPSTADLGKYYAVVIGINDYKGTVWSPLKNAKRDAKAMESILKEKYGFDEIYALYDKEATRENILQDIDNLSKRLNENDNLLIYYSGHGIEVAGEGYWVPVNARTNSVHALVSNNDIKNIVAASKNRHSLIIVDACFSATIFKAPNYDAPADAGTDVYYDRVSKLQSRQAITSGGLAPVPDSRGNICEGKHSVFACYLLDRLENNDKKYIDASELFQLIKIPVAHSSPTPPRFGYIQNVGDEGGQFIFRTKKEYNNVVPNGNGKPYNKEASFGIATGAKSGTYIIFGKDMKRIANNQLPLQVIETKGSLDNYKRLLNGDEEINFAIVQYDVLQSEDRSGVFRKNKSEDIKMVFPLYGEEIHILAKKGSGITTFEQLRDKKVIVGAEGSGTWISIRNLQRKTKMEWQGIAKGFDDGLKDLLAGKVDAVIYVAGSPTHKLGSLSSAAANFINLVEIPADSELSKIYQPTTITADTYEWMEEDVSTYSITSILVSFDYEEGTKEYQAITALVGSILGQLNDLKTLGHPKWAEVCPLDYDKVPWDMHPAAEDAIEVWKEMFGSCEE